jgi:uncharacterized SAM-binding protein YcdF (DUF218 family)
METVKLVIAWAISPLIIAGAIQVLAGILWYWKRKRFARILLMTSFGILLVGSLPVLSHARNRAQQYVHPPLDPAVGLSSDRAVVAMVLGTGFNPDPVLPANSRVSGTAHARFLEGVRIYRSRSDVRLLVSVANKDAGKEDKREFLDAMMTLMNLDPDRVDLVTDAESTADEAEIASSMRKAGEQVVVVTSAAHMPRAMTIFDDAGLDPIAAPADFTLSRPGSPGEKAWKQWIPSSDGMAGTRQMLYEWLASFWHGVGGE